jgi:hypothetical protein
LLYILYLLPEYRLNGYSKVKIVEGVAAHVMDGNFLEGDMRGETTILCGFAFFASRLSSHSNTLLQSTHVGGSWRYMIVWPMRPSLATRLVRTPTRNVAAFAAATVTAAPPPATLCHSKLDNHPVAVTPTPSRSVLSHVWFSGSAPYSLPDSDREGDHKPPDERTVKLGKSMCF